VISSEQPPRFEQQGNGLAFVNHQIVKSGPPSWPVKAVMAGKGWAWTSQRCGRYAYRKILVHTTNPDHLMPTTPSPIDIPALAVGPRYRSG
jgi:hypothetical protein